MESEYDTIDGEDFDEVIPPEEGSVVGHILSQLRPGMDLSRVTLPTFILEPRSMIQRFIDWTSHADILGLVPTESDPLIRMTHVVTWLVSGFHVTPRAPKKPYNSLLGEVYRACLVDANDQIQGTYIAEQVGHHPPVSCFSYVDRKSNAVIWGQVEQRSKFLLNSAAALLNHNGTTIQYHCVALGEKYTFRVPDVYCRGILIGRLAMEMCGLVEVYCEQTGVKATIDFKAKPKVGGKYNNVVIKIYPPKDPNARKEHSVIKMNGRWSAFLRAHDLRNDRKWITFDVRRSVPLRIIEPTEDLITYESQVIWKKVTEHILIKDLKGATEHKLALEEKQRIERNYFDENNIPFLPQCFEKDTETGLFVPKDLDLRPYDPNEPPQTMHPPFHIPDAIQRAESEGITKSVFTIQGEIEAMLNGQ